MTTTLLLFGYAVAVAWWTPALLGRLTAAGISAQLGLAAWLTAMASALAAAAVALQLLARAAVDGWSRLAEVVCRSVSGQACTATGYQGAAVEVALGVAAIVAGLAAAVLAWRYGRSVQRAQRQTRAHADVARITGHRLPGHDDAVVLDAAQPVAYCVPGRPATIVVSSGALAVLDQGQLGAVLAHERAHLAGRHHLVIAVTRASTAALPGVPLFARGAEHVARLAEMCADDTAARRSGRGTLAAALLTMATGAAVPAHALGASACAVAARLQRLVEEPGPAARIRYGLALASVTVLLALAPVLVTGFAGR
jgi:Zn-dependent protease with chaperone function